MFPRLLLWFAIVVGLAVTPVSPALACSDAPVPQSCQHCCADSTTGCCDISSSSNVPVEPAKVAGHSTDLKTVSMPTLSVICLQPVSAPKHPALQRHLAARLPVQPLLNLTCIRLI